MIDIPGTSSSLGSPASASSELVTSDTSRASTGAGDLLGGRAGGGRRGRLW